MSIVSRSPSVLNWQSFAGSTTWPQPFSVRAGRSCENPGEDNEHRDREHQARCVPHVCLSLSADMPCETGGHCSRAANTARRCPGGPILGKSVEAAICPAGPSIAGFFRDRGGRVESQPLKSGRRGVAEPATVSGGSHGHWLCSCTGPGRPEILVPASSPTDPRRGADAVPRRPANATSVINAATDIVPTPPRSWRCWRCWPRRRTSGPTRGCGPSTTCRSGSSRSATASSRRRSGSPGCARRRCGSTAAARARSSRPTAW